MSSDRSSTSSSEGRRAGSPWVAALAAALVLGAGHVALALPPALESEVGALPPFARTVYTIDSAFAPGLSARSRFTRNVQGLRGSVLAGTDRDVLLIGGSTAACTLLDDADTVGAELERTLPAGARVGTMARGGHTADRMVEVVAQALARPDTRAGTVVAMFGANEVELFINNAPWLPAGPGAPEGVSFDEAGPYGPANWSETFAGWYQAGNHGRFLVRPREAYAAAPKVESLAAGHVPALRDALGTYRAALARLHRLADDHGRTLVLVTQPVAFDAEAGRDHGGWAPFFYAQPGRGFLPSPALMFELTEAFNTITRTYARDAGLPLVDVAAEVGPCAECFYDQWHFTLTGASRTAALIAPAVGRSG